MASNEEGTPLNESLLDRQINSVEDLILALHDMRAVVFGSFKLKSGIISPYYIDLRLIISYPSIFAAVARFMFETVLKNHSIPTDNSSSIPSRSSLPFSHVCGVPYTALPIASLMSVRYSLPMIMKRKEGPKDYGRKREIEGAYSEGDKILIVEDLITSGASILETRKALMSGGLKAFDAVVLIDREQGGADTLKKEGVTVHSVVSVTKILDILYSKGKINDDMKKSVLEFIEKNKSTPPPPSSLSSAAAPAPTSATPSSSSSSSPSVLKLSFAARAAQTTNALSSRLLLLMEQKKSNLCLSLDVSTRKEFFDLVHKVGPFIVVLKTHMDIMSDFSEDVIKELMDCAEKYQFIIFEDRKFADIGNTVRLQYEGGVHKIVQWSDITNAHPVPGPAIIDGLKASALPYIQKNIPRGLLLIAEMSSEGTLAKNDYTKKTIEWAEKNKDFVMGFICQNHLSNDSGMIHCSPGVQLPPKEGVVKGDGLGQQYNTPDKVIAENGSDLIIVGRAILNAKDPQTEAKLYQEEGWKAYLKRIAAE